MFSPGQYFLDFDVVRAVLRTTNPAVLQFQAKRIALLSIAESGLNGVAVTSVIALDSRSSISYLLKFYSSLTGNVLYIPESWSYPLFDAVLVSRRRITATAATVQANAAPLHSHHSNVESSSISESPTAAANLDSESPADATRPRELVHIEFIRISLGEATAATLAQTRAILRTDSPERLLWHRAAASRDADVDVTFSLRWLVSRAEAARIPTTAGFDGATEKVNQLWDVHIALKL